MPDIKTIADKADVIVNGYAFIREDCRVRVLNLNNPDKAVVIRKCIFVGLNIAIRAIMRSRNIEEGFMKSRC